MATEKDGSSGGGGDHNHSSFYRNPAPMRGFVGPFKLHMWVPTEEVGIVIGKSGQNVKKIALETNTQVVIAKDLDPNLNKTSNEYWTRVSLTGLAEQTFIAYKVIHKIVDDVDGVVGEFKMKKWGHYIILGKGYDTIKRLSADHQVRINVPDQRRDPENSKVQLEGEIENVEQVYRSIVDEINKQTGRQSSSEKKGVRDLKKQSNKRVDTELTITPEDFKKLSSREDFNWTKLHRMVKTAFHVSARNKDAPVVKNDAPLPEETNQTTTPSQPLPDRSPESTNAKTPTSAASVPNSVAEKSSQVFILSGEETNVENAIQTIKELIEDETKNPRDMFRERAIYRNNKSEKRGMRSEKKHQRGGARNGVLASSKRNTQNERGGKVTPRNRNSKGQANRRRRGTASGGSADDEKSPVHASLNSGDGRRGGRRKGGEKGDGKGKGGGVKKNVPKAKSSGSSEASSGSNAAKGPSTISSSS